MLLLPFPHFLIHDPIPHTGLVVVASLAALSAIIIECKESRNFLPGWFQMDSQQKVDGWRHFQVVNRKIRVGGCLRKWLLPVIPIFWLNAKLLKNRSQWQAGWQSLQEIEEIEGDVS